MKKIDISTKKYPNTFALVDDEDYEYLSQWKWHCDRKYAIRNTWDSRTFYMHRVVNDTPQDMFTDHINMDGLDNRKCNLRTCTKAQNNMNRIQQKNNTSGYKGVYWSKQKNKWHARIKIHGKHKHLGFFIDKDDAGRAYNRTSKEIFGEFAVVNKIGG